MSTITTLDVTGMTCGHCVSAVTKELEGVPGAGKVSVTLEPEGTSHVTVFSAEPLPEDAVRAAIDEAGYDVAAISTHSEAEEFAQLADVREETYGTTDGGTGPVVELTTRDQAENQADAQQSGGGCGCGGCGCGNS